MKKINISLLIIAVFIATACNNKSQTHKHLEQIDSLLLGNNLVDTAVVMLRNVELKTQEDTAYYNILMSAAEYGQEWKIKNLDAINYSIDFYSKKADKLKLANAYYYKALYFIGLQKYDENAAVLLKKAEQLAENTGNVRLLNRIYSALTIVNGTKGEYSEALKYSDKECATAKRLRDNYCLAYAFMARSTTYKAIHYNDSSEYYIMQCKSLADNIEGEDKAFFYNYLGECFMQDNPAAAKKYFNDALKYLKLSDTYANLAKIYYAENQYETAEGYCDSALIDARIAVRNETLALMAEKSYEYNNISKYKQATDELVKNLKLEIQSNEQNRILELQRKYDFEKQRAEYKRKQWLLYSAIGLLVGLCALVLILYKLRLQKIRNRELELENANSLLYSEITDLSNKIATCKSHIENLQLLTNSDNTTGTYSSNNEKINQLNTRLNILNNKQLGYYEKGAKIFQLIELNLPITKYNNDWADCVYYFNTKYPEQTIFEEYNGLTISDKIFIIIAIFLKKTDEDIERILAISPVTVRSRRSKIRKKKETIDKIKK